MYQHFLNSSALTFASDNAVVISNCEPLSGLALRHLSPIRAGTFMLVYLAVLLIALFLCRLTNGAGRFSSLVSVYLLLWASSAFDQGG